MTDAALHKRMANAIRALAMDGVEKAKSGHPGMPMGMADVATVLFTRFLKFDPADPRWPDRDRFVLSAGHGSMLLYALLYLTGYESMPIEELKKFRQLHSKTPGHPENFVTAGVETTTGPLGQGVGASVGMALAERMLAAEFGGDVVDHHTFVLCSDGDLMEGLSQEAIAIAGHLKLNRLIFLFDDNGISIDGPLTLSDSVDQVKRFESAGWAATRVDGHDQEAVAKAIEAALKSDRPTLIACRTTIGYGAPKKAGTSKAHGEPLGEEEIAGARALGWIRRRSRFQPTFWMRGGRPARAAPAREAWQTRLQASPKRAEFERRIARTRPADLATAIAMLKGSSPPKADARHPQGERAGARDGDGSGARADPRFRRPDALQQHQDEELSPRSRPATMRGRYIHYGIREHGMAAAMNGMAIHGGLQPAGGTSLVFTDYARPAMRIAALAGIPVIYVMTHDSIGLGEDGPTHQPVEQLAALRAMPNMRVFRPADAMETAECWQLALERIDGPTVIALTRQNLAAARTVAAASNLCAHGAYELSPQRADRRIDLRLRLGGRAGDGGPEAGERNIAGRVVSVPSLDLFLLQPDEARRKIVGDAPVRIAVEAAVRFGWDAVIGPDGLFVGMKGFGASAPYKDVYKHFGITAEAVAEAVVKRHNG